MIKVLLFQFAVILVFFISSCAELQPCTITSIDSPKLNKLSREGIDAELSMRIKNPNQIGVVVFPSQFEGSVNGINIGKVNLTKKVRIKATSDEVQSFKIMADFSKLGLSDITKILPVVSSGNITITLKGHIKAGKWYYKKKFPVEFSRTINIKQ